MSSRGSKKQKKTGGTLTSRTGGKSGKKGEITSSQHDAQNEIVNCLHKSRLRTPGDEADHLRIVTLLRKFPDLANQKIRLIQDNALPLYHLLLNGASLDIIQSVVELNPGALRHQAKKYPGYFPLHLACTRNCSAEVVEYLAKECPESCVSNDRSGSLPIHYALQRGTLPPLPANTIKELIKLDPSCLRAKQNNDTLRTLEKVFHDAVPTDICSYAAATFEQPKCCPVSTFSFAIDDSIQELWVHRTITLDMVRAEALSQILPHFIRFRCCPTNWTFDGTMHLLEHLKTNESIEDLRPLSLSRQVLSPLRNDRSNALLHAFRSLVEHNRCVKRFGVSLMNENTPETDSTVDHDVMRTLLSAVEHNRTIQALEILGFRIHCGHLFRRFLSSGVLPQSLKLHFFQCFTRYEYDMDTDWTGCFIRELSLSKCTMVSSECRLRLLQDIVRMPLLKKLTISFFGYPLTADNTDDNVVDFSEPLLTILAHNQVEYIQICHNEDFHVDFPRICGALARNTSLKTYDFDCMMDNSALECMADLLEHHNVTLEFVTRYCCISRGRIWYYTSLNKVGRAKIREESTSLTDFVGLMCALLENPLRYVGMDEELQMLLYGLLREKPDLWCSWQTAEVDESAHQRLDDLWGTLGNKTDYHQRYLYKESHQVDRGVLDKKGEKRKSPHA